MTGSISPSSSGGVRVQRPAGGGLGGFHARAGPAGWGPGRVPRRGVGSGRLLPADQRARHGDRMAALAGGSLAMLTNSLMPFAYERAGSLAGVATVVGFCVSLLGT